MSRRLLVLGYHNIDPTWAFDGTSPEVARRGFEKQVRSLRRWTTVVPLRSALEDLAAGRPLPPRAVALTFDDGYRDNATFAAPVLQSAGLPATFFLVPGFLSDTSRVWWEELGWAFAHATAPVLSWDGARHDTSTPAARAAAMSTVADSLKLFDRGEREAAVTELRGRLAAEGPEPPSRLFMDWDEASGLVRAGHDVGSHTCAHPILSREDPAVQARELADSRRDLEAHFQRPVDVLAYPNGRAQDYSATTLDLVRQAGYAFAVTTHPALARSDSPAIEVPRVLVDAETDLRQLVRRAVSVARRIVDRRLPARRGND